MSQRLSRREFIRRTSAAAAAPIVLPASVFGTQEKAAPSNRITLGFIGMGKMNSGLLNAFLGYADVQVVAVCDVDTTRRENAKKTVDTKYAGKGCAGVSDFNELIGRKDIDAVVIATPDHWHAIPVIEAAKAKKDVYCEKPLSLTIHEAKLMIDAVRKHDRVFQTGSQQRSQSNGSFRTACEYARSGRLGKLKKIIVGVGGPSKPCDLPEEAMEPGLDWERWLGPAPKRAYHSILSPRGVHNHFPRWRSYREYSGGAMTDWGAHHFDIAQWALDADQSGPVEVIPPEDPAAEKGVRFLYANGVEVEHGDSIGVTIIGTEGRIEADRGKILSKPETILKEPLGEKDVKLRRTAGHYRDFVECVKSRQRPICDVEIGARSVTVCHLGNLAYRHRKRLKWDPQNWRFAGGEGDEKWLDRERRDPYQLPPV